MPLFPPQLPPPLFTYTSVTKSDNINSKVEELATRLNMIVSSEDSYKAATGQNNAYDTSKIKVGDQLERVSGGGQSRSYFLA